MWYWIFWISWLLIFYIYLGYPASIFLLARMVSKGVDKREYYPTVTFILIVHNGQKHIFDRIKNLLSLDYPNNLVKILVVSDGSQDNTVELVRPFLDENKNIRLVVQPERMGKAFCISRVAPECDSEILVFCDVRQKYDSNVLKKLIRNFNDHNVGAVSGELVFLDGDKTLVGQGVDFYWSYEKFLRKMESAFDSTIGATGAIYAIRREMFKPVAQDILLDDVMIPLEIVLMGYRTVFESEAIAYDYVALTKQEEKRRKIRTIAGNFQLFFKHPKFLNPMRNRIFFQTFSHKFLRLFSPIFMVFLFVSNLFLVNDSFMRTIFIFQVLFYTTPLWAHLLQRYKIKLRFISAMCAFIMLNVFTVRAFFVFLFVDSKSVWSVKNQ